MDNTNTRFLTASKYYNKKGKEKEHGIRWQTYMADYFRRMPLRSSPSRIATKPQIGLQG